MKSIKKGFTLVELLIVMAILITISVIMVGQLNPVGLIGKANDANRKKDLGRIKVAFEEYFNDKGCYPSGALLTSLNNDSNCQSSVFRPWLGTWPCDPVSRKHYYVEVGVDSVVNNQMPCPHWFKVMTNLENKEDPIIPFGWYSKSVTHNYGDSTTNLTINQVNNGVSSDNIRWYDDNFDVSCINPIAECYSLGGDGNFRALDYATQHLNSYTIMNRNCLTDCCFQGKPCTN